MAATLQVAIQEKESLRDAIKEKDHTLDLLSMDKIYLSKEVHCQAEQVKKLETELERQHEKLREVKRARTELYNKVLADNKDSQTANEQRLQAEISRIQERTNQDIEKIRKEANAVADEKVRTFREMRDEAMATADMCRSELRDSKAAYDELLLKFRELQRVADCKEAETRNNLKLSNFELDRLKVVLEETKNALDQTRLENEALVAKVKILKEKVNEEKNRPIEELKNELEKTVSELKEELRVTRAQLEAYQKEKNAQLKASLSERKSQIDVSVEQKAQSFSVPRAEASGSSEIKLKGSLPETRQLEEQLRSVTEEKDRVSFRLQSVQEDIRKLLRARGSVEQLQSLLKEKGVSIGTGSRLKSITTSTKSILKVKKGSASPKISPRISNLDRSATPTKKEIQTMIEHGETPPRCHQHRSCSPHYPKAYEEVVDALSRRAPAPFSQDRNPDL
ncbi:hypothetical protein KC19_5G100200 [Ceratodon purpureus]|uniref:Uncharacterized protein n=1 Tax=Ceratodon purpureus TaxID=3225 RepID=A0A8T0I1J2_CERPU|nr:hypothetical protein KC19_5G100200 [Ceratodon purpureus]